MKIIILFIAILFSQSTNAETVFRLNGLFETFGSDSIKEMPNSPGELLVRDNGINVTRKVSTCFSPSFCGPELIKNQSIISIGDGKVFLKEDGTNKESSETILLANADRVILAKTIIFTDSLTIENWELRQSENIVTNYALSDLYLVSMGVIFRADGSTGSLSISPGGGSIHRNLMVCFDGCELPTNKDFDITVVPGKKVFFTDKSSSNVIENLIINADHNAIVLYERGSEMITIWKPL